MRRMLHSSGRDYLTVVLHPAGLAVPAPYWPRRVDRGPHLLPGGCADVYVCINCSKVAFPGRLEQS